MPTYKLTYFDARGRGEVARQLFHLAGVPFEDIRVTRTEWQELKPRSPFGQMPLLEVYGNPLAQSFAIVRYLAKEFVFAGDSPFESAWVDAIADQHKDFFNEIRPGLLVYTGVVPGGTTIRDDKNQQLKNVVIPARDKYFDILEKIAKDNGSNGHFVGSSLTWVDLVIADHVFLIHQYIPGFLDGFPTVLETVKNVESTPRPKEWIEQQPVSTF